MITLNLIKKMATAKLPLKMRIAQSLLTHECKCSQDIFSELHNDYGCEAQFNIKTIEQHLLSLKAVGIVQNCDLNTSSHTDDTYYTITNHGEMLVNKTK